LAPGSPRFEAASNSSSVIACDYHTIGSACDWPKDQTILHAWLMNQGHEPSLAQRPNW